MEILIEAGMACRGCAHVFTDVPDREIIRVAGTAAFASITRAVLRFQETGFCLGCSRRQGDLAQAPEFKTAFL